MRYELCCSDHYREDLPGREREHLGKIVKIKHDNPSYSTRVLILDWDVHHGNGIQHAFESDPRVLYISIHRYDNGLFFPSSEDGNYDRVGKGDGEGYNVNIPWNKVLYCMCGNIQYLIFMFLVDKSKLAVLFSLKKGSYEIIVLQDYC